MPRALSIRPTDPQYRRVMLEAWFLFTVWENSRTFTVWYGNTPVQYKVKPRRRGPRRCQCGKYNCLKRKSRCWKCELNRRAATRPPCACGKPWYRDGRCRACHGSYMLANHDGYRQTQQRAKKAYWQRKGKERRAEWRKNNREYALAYRRHYMRPHLHPRPNIHEYRTANA